MKVCRWLSVSSGNREAQELGAMVAAAQGVLSSMLPTVPIEIQQVVEQGARTADQSGKPPVVISHNGEQIYMDL